MGKNVKKEDLSIGTMVFCIVGVVLTVLGIMLLKNTGFKMNIIGTEGTVTGFQTSTNANGETERVVANFTYKANRSNYTASLDTNDTNIKIGDKITLYYDVFSPTVVGLKRNGYQGYIALIVGIILVLKTGPRFYRIMRDNYL
ncbi:MAG: DUF3592 domain-containing protein [Bacilli bacterium]|nr:DUF3592 domain-containing protein [Bacilli bacterium]